MKANSITNIAIGLLTGVSLFSSCRPTPKQDSAKYEIAQISGSRICIDSTWESVPHAIADSIIAPYKDTIDREMGKVIGSSEMTMESGRPESLLSNLIAEVLRLSATQVLGHPADIGVMNMGGIRNILPKGDITLSNVYEILPFENSLCVLTMKGSEVKNLLTVMASLNGEGLSGARIKMTEQGEMLQCSVQEAPIDNQKDYTIATIDYLADGNDGFTPFLRAEKRECPPNATLRSLFLNYIEQQTAEGKKVTSRIDGRITIVPGSN